MTFTTPTLEFESHMEYIIQASAGLGQLKTWNNEKKVRSIHDQNLCIITHVVVITIKLYTKSRDD